MSLPPNTTPLPQSPLVPAMSPAIRPAASEGDKTSDETDKASTFKIPKLRLEVRDLAHQGAPIFLRTIDTIDVFNAAVRNVLRWLYVSPSDPGTNVPGTRSVTLVLRDMGGVAYTTGTDLDPDHKEIHFSMRYIAGIKPPSRRVDEITGVLTHELVHCFQYNGTGSCPGGLIEGVADWVRLRCGLCPPHWKRESDGKWDAGYQKTAYFLEYLEHRFGEGTVRGLNEKLRRQKYEEKTFWTELLGSPVETLWEEYAKNLKDTASNPTE
jgi:hypothetical protein